MMRLPVLRIRLAWTAVWLALFGTVAAHAQLERILSFDSQVTVHPDASLDVTERIAIEVNGQEVKRGIVRDFPTRYTDQHGETVKVDFTVLSVKREGRNEPYVLEPLANGTRIRIGRSEVLLPRRPTIYEIRYRTARQIGFFDDHDELFWNVTSYASPFPIEKSRVDIDLPSGADIAKAAAYAGPQGTLKGDVLIESATGTRFSARTSKRLAPYEGFSVVISWPKGIVAAPSSADRARWWLFDNLSVLLICAGCLVIGLYYWAAWKRVGRDPPGGPIVPLFQPPGDMQAAEVRYVRQQGFDAKTFTSALIELATKKALIIEQEGSDYTLKPTASGQSLTKVDSDILHALGPKAIEVDDSNYKRIQAAQSKLESDLESRFRGAAFNLNRGWFLGGLALSVAFFAAAILAHGSLFLIGMVAASSLLVFLGVLASTFGWILLWIFLGGNRGLLVIRALPFLILALVILGIVAVFLLYLYGDDLPLTLALTLGGGFVIFGLNLIFFYLLPAPTRSGRALLDEIEGFRLFLSATEEDRLNLLHPPERTPELFERFLPYAFALDCEQRWSDQFDDVLTKAGIETQDWYRSDRRLSSSSFGRSMAALGSGLSSRTAAASSPPGSSSGFSSGGGRGGAGGGGGGGGVGGW